MASSEKLVIVESPTKAKTIRKYLGKGYRVEASMGHVRDLPASADEIPPDVKGKPWARLGVDVENGFQPIYVIPREKKKVVAELRKAVKKAGELYLATDEDREGESIGWHLVEVLKPKIPVRRMVFHEITEAAIAGAIDAPRELDQNLVRAQETRRVLDRLVGYTVSPLLWKKVAARLSAGRVQSVAVRILVLRERERMAFVSGTYWDLKAQLEKDDQVFEGQLVSVDGTRLATGKDFDESTGKIAEGKTVLLLGEEEAKALHAGLRGKPFVVKSVETRQATRSPYPPFTTSTLQQEANRKLGLGANRTMRIAQRLYESGLITYMRTDSVHVAEEAVKGIRGMIASRYGEEYLCAEVRKFKTKSKGAQEAHEAIRPAGAGMPTSEELSLTGEQAKLYELIWMRTAATQMAEARLAFTTARLVATSPEGKEAEFRASGREVVFPGFFRAYVEGSDDPDEALDDRSQPLPKLEEASEVNCKELEPVPHETKPPARYTEATLVKALEADGIGRPSTYASIINTIQRRGYVMAKNKQLVPTFTAMAVTQLLEEALAPIVDSAFTAKMEERLDDIAEGEPYLDYLSAFYNDDLLTGVKGGEALDAREICTIREQSIDPYEIRVGRYGAFIQYGETDEGKAMTVSLPAENAPGDIDKTFIDNLVALARRGRSPMGVDPETQENVYVLSGPYGPYVQRGETGDFKDKKAPKPKRVSIPKTIDPLTVDFELAVKLLELPKQIGRHPETEKIVKAGIGRYGPYVVHDAVYASLKPEDDVLTVQLPRALELLADKKVRRRRSEPIKELGVHPEENNPINVMEGPYGAYVKCGKINASIPEGFAVEDITMDLALVWIAEKAERKGIAMGRKKKKKKKKTAAKKTKKKKTKKAGSKKKPAKKKPAKKKKKKAKNKAKKKSGSTRKVKAGATRAEPQGTRSPSATS